MEVLIEPDDLSKAIRNYCISNDLFDRSFEPLTHPLAGCCKVATYAYYIIKNDSSLQIGRVPVEVHDDFLLNHYYLRKDDKIIDLTREQFTSYSSSIEIHYGVSSFTRPELAELDKSEELIEVIEHIRTIKGVSF